MKKNVELENKKQGDSLINPNLVILILTIFIFLALFTSCSRIYSQFNDGKGLENFPSLLSFIDEIPHDVLRPYIPFLDENSAIVFFNPGYETITIDVFDKNFEFRRPESSGCPTEKACICYLKNYDYEKKSFDSSSCEPRDLTFVASKYTPLEIFNQTYYNNAKACRNSQYSRKDCNSLKDYTDYESMDFFKISSKTDKEISGIVIDKDIISFYKKELEIRFYRYDKNLVICYDRNVCDNERDKFKSDYIGLDADELPVRGDVP